MFNRSFQKLDLYFSFLIFFIAWILYAANTWNGDRDAYEVFYYERNIKDWGYEFGYGFLNVGFRSLGLSYQWFVVFIATVSILFIFHYVSKLSGIKSLFALSYLISFFPLDYVLMRNTLAFSVLLLGFKFLIFSGFGNRLIYLFFVLIASTVHQSMLVFILFGFSPVSHILKSGVFFVLFFLSLIFYVFLIPYFIDLLGVVDHLALYHEFNYVGYLVAVIIVLIPAFSIFLLDNISKKVIFSVGGFACKYRAVVLNVNLLSLFFVFLYFESPIFVRLFRYVTFLNLVYISWLCLIDFKRVSLYFAVTLFYMIFLFLYFIYPYLGFTVIPLFENNYLIGDFFK